MTRQHYRRLFEYFAGSILLTLIAGCAASAPNYPAMLANSDRPEAERAPDAVRKPREVMAFYEVKNGDKVADLVSTRGYIPRYYRNWSAPTAWYSRPTPSPVRSSKNG